MHDKLAQYDGNICSTGICQIKFLVLARFYEENHPPNIQILGSLHFTFSDQRHLLGSKKEYPLLQLYSQSKTSRLNNEIEEEGGFS